MNNRTSRIRILIVLVVTIVTIVVLSTISMFEAEHSRPETASVDGLMAQPTPDRVATLNSLFDDRLVDSDGDTTFDTLEIDVGIDVDFPTTLDLLVKLVDARGERIAEGFATQSLGAGSGTMTIQISGDDLQRWGQDGPYYLGEVVLSTGHLFVDVVRDAYTTQDHLLSALEPLPIEISGTYVDGVRDIDGDGTLDELFINAGVNINEPGTYEVIGLLADSFGNYIFKFRSEVVLSTSDVDVQMTFTAESIRRSHHDGPYTLIHFTIRRDGQTVIRDSEGPHTTSPYPYLAFGSATTPVIEVIADSPFDTSAASAGDVVFEYLRIGLKASQLSSLVSTSSTTRLIQGNCSAVHGSSEGAGCLLSIAS